MLKKGKRVFVQVKNAANPFRSRTKRIKGVSCLEIDPMRSKLGAGIVQGLQHHPAKGDIIMYLGASAGYTVSFVAHAAKLVFAVEVAPLMCRDLVLNTKAFDNVAPVLADAHLPLDYAHRACTVDYVFQDVSQPDQVAIFTRNVDLFLKNGGLGAIAIKARSIDSTRDPDDIFKNSVAHLSEKYEVLEQVRLDPFEKDHMLIVIRKRDQ